MTEDNRQKSLLSKIATYTEIFEKNPDSTIFVSLSEAYRKLGMLEDARTIAEKGLQNNPEFCPGHIVLGRIHYQLADFDSSSRSFNKALEIDENSLAALVGFARINLQNQKIEDARSLLTKARSISPADPIINSLLDSLPPEPEEVVEEVVEETPQEEVPEDAPIPTGTLAELYLQQGLHDKALEIYQLLQQDDPYNLELRRKIRDIEALKGGSEEAGQAPEDVLPVNVPEGQESAQGSETEQEPVQIQDPVVEQELEPGYLEDSGGSPAPDSEILDEAPEAIAETLEINSEVETDISLVNPAPESSALDTLTQWLENIQQRRGDVQTNP